VQFSPTDLAGPVALNQSKSNNDSFSSTINESIHSDSIYQQLMKLEQTKISPTVNIILGKAIVSNSGHPGDSSAAVVSSALVSDIYSSLQQHFHSNHRSPAVQILQKQIDLMKKIDAIEEKLAKLATDNQWKHSEGLQQLVIELGSAPTLQTQLTLCVDNVAKCLHNVKIINNTMPTQHQIPQSAFEQIHFE
jgi:hypothetical protein